MNVSNYSTKIDYLLPFGFETPTGPEQTHSLEFQYKVAIHLAAGLCSFMTVFGNLLVIGLFAYDKRLRTFSNYLILNLALSDLIVGLFSMNVFTLENVDGHTWNLGVVLCKLWLIVDYTASDASVMNLLMICLERYVAVMLPFRYSNWCTPRAAPIIMITPWVLSFLLWGIPMLLWDFSVLSRGHCYIPFLRNNQTVTLITAIMGFYLPITVMSILYGIIIRQFKKRVNTRREPPGSDEEHKIIILVKAIVMLFALLWLPYNIIVIVVALCREKCDIPHYWWSLSYWMCYLNSAVNPICYGIYNKNFRRSLTGIYQYFTGSRA